jgi:hypothetical protein
MKFKPIHALLILYLAPLLMATDCGDCNCGDFREYNVIYNGVNFSAWDTSKFQNKVVDGVVSKNAFGVGLYVKYDQNGVAFIYKPKHISHASFGMAYAWSCSCVEPEYHFTDPIKSIEIKATDTTTQEMVDVTSNFTTRDYDDKDVTIPELLEQYIEQKQSYLHWQLDLTNADNIPDKAIFTLTVTLDSGKAFSEQTKEIEFI